MRRLSIISGTPIWRFSLPVSTNLCIRKSPSTIKSSVTAIIALFMRNRLVM